VVFKDKNDFKYYFNRYSMMSIDCIQSRYSLDSRI
jgi:hypothetical protein